MANRLVIAAVVTVVASCGAGSAVTGGEPAPGASGTRPAASLAQTQHREQAAVAYAEQLAGAGPHVPGETPLGTIPAKLERPDQTIGVSNLITRAHYWSVPEAPQHLYAALKKVPVTHLRLSGWGRPGAGSNASNYADLFYTGTRFPRYLNDVELYIEILGVAGGGSDVAAFAEVVPYPLRQANELIPIDATKVVIMRTRVGGGPPLRQVTLAPAQARQFITAINGAKVRPPGTCIGGLPPPFGYAATITSGTVTWQVTWTGLGNCDALSVRRGDQSLADLQTAPALMHLLDSDVLGADGSVDGGFWRVSGDSLLPLTGTVTLATHGHVVAHIMVGQQTGFGDIEFIVPPGRYILTGRSPQFATGTVTCRGQRPAVVRADHSTNVDVRCRHT